MANEDIIKMLNEALEAEYLSHAELVEGLNAEPIMARLKEIASDEAKHQALLRELVGSYLRGIPSMKIAQAKSAKTIKEILEVNLLDEKDAVALYTKILQKVNDEKKNMPYVFWRLEHAIRHIIMDEQEHIMELETLLER